MYKKIRNKVITLAIGVLISILVATAVSAATRDELFSLASPTTVVVNSSFISPLDEVFGDGSLGKEIFIASNTIVRADPGTSACLGNETNLQDNILFLALRNLPSPSTT